MSQDLDPEGDRGSLEERLRHLEALHRIGIALSAERNRARLLETILLEAKNLCNADGGTLYLRTSDDHLRFTIMRTDTLDIALGGTTGRPIDLPQIPIEDPDSGRPNHNNIATYAASVKRSVNIEDAYNTDAFDFSGTKKFDQTHGYHSKSFLTIPLVNSEGHVIGVLQLLNARDDQGAIGTFSAQHQETVEALASQAAIALDNMMLLDGQKALLESFIKMIAAAIDAKSPYTGGHCERVPIITEMLAREACQTTHGQLAQFGLNEEEWYELRIAAWLHDCGKVVTPVHVMDKATKLETIFDRIELVRARFEVVARDIELAHLRRRAAPNADVAAIDASLQTELAALRDDLKFLEVANVGGEFLAPDDQARIRAIGARTYTQAGQTRPVLSPEECANLCISRGTLTDEERLIINDHMVQTIKMLEALPFPRTLARVPEYAGGHHEKMDGHGYPKGIFAGDMSIPARIMAIADVFEALTAVDRPYKRGKKLSEAMDIMGKMKQFNHLDPHLLDLFVQSGVYREYAEKYLPADLIDEVDEAAILAIEPKPFDLPPDEVRAQRWRGFLEEYGGRP